MTNRPELVEDFRPARGLAAAALFVVLAAVFVTAEFGSPEGFPEGASIVAGIGYAMFNLTDLADVGAEGFLVVFLVMAVVLDAAIDGAVYLASRETEETEGILTALTDGGRDEGGEP